MEFLLDTDVLGDEEIGFATRRLAQPLGLEYCVDRALNPVAQKGVVGNCRRFIRILLLDPREGLEIAEVNRGIVVVVNADRGAAED